MNEKVGDENKYGENRMTKMRTHLRSLLAMENWDLQNLQYPLNSFVLLGLEQSVENKNNDESTLPTLKEIITYHLRRHRRCFAHHLGSAANFTNFTNFTTENANSLVGNTSDVRNAMADEWYEFLLLHSIKEHGEFLACHSYRAFLDFYRVEEHFPIVWNSKLIS